MNNCKVIVSDGQIWNSQAALLELVQSALTGNTVTVDLLHEGPDCEDIGLDRMLDGIVAQFDLDPDQFVIQTSNQVPSSRYREQRQPFIELTTAQSRILKKQWPIWQYRFGMFVGRSNWQRLGIASYLHSHHQSQTLMTFHYDHKSDFHSSNFGLEQLVTRHWSDWSDIYRFVQHLPITDETHEYPITWNNRAFDLEPKYQNIFCDIVCETFWSRRSFFVTEKTFRAIANRRPFLVQSSKYFLKNLQRLGFKTFDHWWDEQYDQDPADARYETFKQAIDWIASQDNATLYSWYQEMQPILDHNCQVLANLTNQQILSTEFYHD
jgi:hypothetical protein